MNDFDFLTGTWDIANRWRISFLDPDSTGEEFPAVSHASRHWASKRTGMLFPPVTGAFRRRRRDLARQLVHGRDQTALRQRLRPARPVLQPRLRPMISFWISVVPR